MEQISREALSRIVEEAILPRVAKPSRYLGCEVNSVRKDPSEVDLRIALAFPDLYDLGLPNLGLLILYGILNQQPGIQAERVYAPAPDLEAVLRERGLPLFSLETRTPLGDFDCIGFTLQYELTYTNLLNMLDLAGIPLLAQERNDSHPIILGGGPCAFNPEPIADFMDALAIGDGEDVVLEIAACLRETKGRPRGERLRRLAEIPGVYVPALYETRTLSDGTLIPVGPRVRRRVVADLDAAPFPTAYVVPFAQQVHDRVSLEVLRGCTQGCRFCQAGAVTRPVRERSLEKLRQLAEESLRQTGYEEVALASLSTCDYSQVRALVQQSASVATPWGAAVSLPSLRLDSFSVELAEMTQSLRKTGLTFAPEAGTARLRDVINKGITDEELLETTGEVFARGWEVVKLYFMIGLPTETDEDVVAIADLARRVLAHGRQRQPKARLNLGVSTFVPRPQTPFQWEPQISIAETQRRQALLSAHLRSGLKFGRHDAFASYLEGVFSRGDRRLGRVLLEAWRLGCRLDAWSEHFDFARWQQAFMAAGLDPDAYLRARAVAEPLPWDHIDTLVTKEFLLAERERAHQGVRSVDCRREHCHQCGVVAQVPSLCASMRRRSRLGAESERRDSRAIVPARPPLEPAQKIRFRFAKTGSVRFLSHLETVAVWTRALRRAGLPVAYSQGFHPQPKLALGTALAVGIETEGDYADVVLNEPIGPAVFAERMNAVLPAGFRVLDACAVPLGTPSLMAQIAAARYQVVVPPPLAEPANVDARVREFLSREACPIVREAKQGAREVDVRPLVMALAARMDAGAAVVEMLLREGEGARARPTDVAGVLFAWGHGVPPEVRVRKLESYIASAEGLRPVLPPE